MAADPVFRVAGLGTVEEQTYRFVVCRGSTTPAEVAERFDVTTVEARNVLQVLQQRGLLVQPEDSRVFTAVDPRSSLHAMTDHLTDQVNRIRDLIPELVEQFNRSNSADDGTAGTQVVTDPAEAANWYVQLQHRAKRDLMIFDRPPYVSAPLEALEVSVMGRGVTWRAVYSADSFARDGAWEETERLARQGERARIVPRLPNKLVVADREIALVSLNLDGIHHDMMVTAASPLVEMLCEVFEHYWYRGLSLTQAHVEGATQAAKEERTGRKGVRPTSSARQVTQEEQSILALIGAGMTDDAIAVRLGMSTRSLRRRSQRLMEALGAENRFQLGVEAARRNWV